MKLPPRQERKKYEKRGTEWETPEQGWKSEEMRSAAELETSE
jgi:hypothetical protein